MKQKLCLGDNYGPKRTQPEHRICIRNLRAVRNIVTRCIAYMLWIGTYKKVLYWYFTRTLPVLKVQRAFIHTFFTLCSAVMRPVCVLDVCRMREILTHSTDTARIRHGGWCNKGTRKTKEIRRYLWSHRGNREESCVCTHAKAPARNGLGLALGLAVAFVAMGNQGMAQESFSVSGKVISAASGAAIEGATVTNKRTRMHAVTDERGDYRIPARPDDVLTYSFVGYMTAEEEIGGRQQITVALDSAENVLEEVEVVSTGYQTIPKERATGSFVFVDSALLNRAVSTDIISRLKGVTPSLLFDERAGGEPKLSIRGRSTIFANADPLIVVDNFPYEGDIRNINPNDVESVSILRDAAAASIWGVRAGNGVIVITTKHGRRNQPLKITLNSSITIGAKPNLWYEPRISSADRIDIEQFLFEKGYYTAQLNNNVTFPVISPAVEIMADNAMDVSEKQNRLAALEQQDILRDVSNYFYQRQFNQQYVLGIQGGSEVQHYFVSAGFDKNTGARVGNSFSRVNLTASNTISMSRLMSLSLSLNVTQNQQRRNTVYQEVQRTFPYQRLIDDAGNPLAIVKDFRQSFAAGAQDRGLRDWQYVPLTELDLADQTDKDLTFRIPTSLTVNILPSLKANVRYQYERQFSKTENLYPEDSYHVRDLINRYSVLSTDGLRNNLPVGAYLFMYNRNLHVHNGRIDLGYDKQWFDHALHAIGGFEVRELRTGSDSRNYYGYDPLTGTGSIVNADTLYPQYPGTGRSRISTSNAVGQTIDRYRSWFANGSYSYLRRYTFSASARLDQSNIFGVDANQRSVPLWSVGLKWDVHEERFFRMKSSPRITIRATYGYNGNLDPSLTAFTTATYYTRGGLRSARITNPPNPDLRWERNAVFNVGVDFEIFNGTLSGNFDYYHRWGKDLLGNARLDPTLGVSSMRVNHANMVGEGFDLFLKTSQLGMGRLRWAGNVWFSATWDKVTHYEYPLNSTSLLFQEAFVDGTPPPVVGKPLAAIYSYPWAGLDPDTGVPRGYLDGEPSTDYNAIARKLTANDLVYHGVALPPVYGSFRQTVSYRNLTLSCNLTYKFGHYFRRNSIQYFTLYNGSSWHRDFARRWKNSGDEAHTSVPAMVYPASAAADNYYRNAEPLVNKADVIRIQDIRLAYSVNGQSLVGLPVSRVECYVYVNNVGTLWVANKNKLDPDYSSQLRASNGGVMILPPPTSAAIGLSFTF